jgi:TIR domain
MPSQRLLYDNDEESLRRLLELVVPLREHLDPKLKVGIEELLKEGYLGEKEEVLERLAKKTDKHDVFICYSWADKPFVRRLANDISKNGFKVWFDEFELLPGDSLYEKIQSGIKNSAWFLIVLSPDSVQSKWCKRELHNAMEEEFARNHVYVVPVLCRMCEIPGFLKEKLWADCSGENYQPGLLQILRRLATPRETYSSAPSSVRLEPAETAIPNSVQFELAKIAVEDQLRISGFIETHKHEIYTKLEQSYRQVIERDHSSTVFFIEVLALVSGIVHVGSNMDDFKRATTWVRQSRPDVDPVSILSTLTLFYVVEKGWREFSLSSDMLKRSIWEGIRNGMQALLPRKE